MEIEQAARICHELNRIYCEELGDHSQKSWGEAPEWQQTSAMNGVQNRILNPRAHPRTSHESWLAEKEATGWVWGPDKDEIRKTHPCCVPYEKLPEEQQVKDALFVGVVDALKGLLPQKA